MTSFPRLACWMLLVLTCFSGTHRAIAQPWIEVTRANEKLAAGDYGEAAAIYDNLLQDNPADGHCWSQHGYCLHAEKRYDEALKSYARAVDLGHNRAVNLYNSACAHALLGNPDEALKWLRRALEARFADQETMELDSDLDSLRSDPRFAELTGITAGLTQPICDTRDEGWCWDLDFLTRRMEQLHWDLYANVTRDDWLSEVESIKADVPQLSDSQLRVRLRKLVARVGDGHTVARLFPEHAKRRLLPVHLYAFPDGVYVIGANKDNADLIGARVLKIGPLPIDAALQAVRPYTSVDNEMGHLASGPAMLTVPSILEAIGAADNETEVHFTCATSGGSEIKRKVVPADFPTQGHGGFLTPSFQYVHDSLKERPLFLQDMTKPLRREFLPDRRVVYFWFGAVMDTPRESLREFCNELVNFIDENSVEHLVIDMRFNGGGNTGLVRPLIDGLIAYKAINRQGHLWVLTGRDTFSAAQNTVNLLDKETNAMFVGEPTGSRPQFVGESTWLILPHSRTRVYCSSRYWQYLDSTDERVWVPPRIAAPLTFADYSQGRDPALERVLAEIDRSRNSDTPNVEPSRADTAATTESS